jgi:hypothetical protein
MDVERFKKEAEDCRREAERSSDSADKEFWLWIAEGCRTVGECRCSEAMMTSMARHAFICAAVNTSAKAEIGA